MVIWNWKHSGKVDRLLSYILAYSTIFFTVGLTIDVVIYIAADNHILLSINGLTILVFATSVLLYLFNRIGTETAISIQIISAAVNNSASIIFYSLTSVEHEVDIMANICVYIILIILAAIIKKRTICMVTIITGLAVFSLASVMLLPDKALLLRLPIIFFIFVGAYLAIFNVIDVTTVIEHENRRVNREQQELLELLNLNPRVLDIIKDENMNSGQIADILRKLDSRLADSIVRKVKNVIITREKITSIVKSNHPNLTNSEIEICCLIVEGKNIAEICEIRHVGVSTVTSMRSRLRSKLKLSPGESLQSYLCSLVNLSL